MEHLLNVKVWNFRVWNETNLIEWIFFLVCSSWLVADGCIRIPERRASWARLVSYATSMLCLYGALSWPFCQAFRCSARRSPGCWLPPRRWRWATSPTPVTPSSFPPIRTCRFRPRWCLLFCASCAPPPALPSIASLFGRFPQARTLSPTHSIWTGNAHCF